MRLLLVIGFLSTLTLTLTLTAQPKPGSGSIEGHVFNAATGAALRKARVELYGSATQTYRAQLLAATDETGRFEFIGLPAGTYRLSASRSGFLDRRSRRAITLGEKDRVTDAEIRLAPQSVISGHVLDEDGDPVERAQMQIFRQIYHNGRREWEGSGFSVTDDKGEYRFPNLSPGSYLLRAADGRRALQNEYGDPVWKLYVPVYYPNTASQAQALPVTVGAGSEIRGVDIHLFKVAQPHHVRVRGRVTGMPPDSASAIMVTVRPAEGDLGGGSTAAEPPDYAFDLRVAPGQVTLTGTVYGDGQQAYGTRELAVTGDIAGVTLAVNPLPASTGRIRLAEDCGKIRLEDVRVRVEASASNPAMAVTSDAAGKLVFSRPMFGGVNYRVSKVGPLPEDCYVRNIQLGVEEVSWDDFRIATAGQLEIVLSNGAGKIGGRYWMRTASRFRFRRLR